MKFKTKTSSNKIVPNLDAWPTQSTDQNIAIEIIRRHSEQFGHVKLLARVGEISEENGGTFEVEFPPWVHELMQRFNALYSPEVSQAVFAKTVEWLVREIFGGHTAVSLQ